eukprot:scpid96846/ scgid7848/ 
MQCTRCERSARIFVQRKSSSGHYWMCTRCTSSWRTVAESNLSSIPGNLMEIVLGFFTLFDLPTSSKVKITPKYKSYQWILSKSLGMIEKNLKLGLVHPVYLDVFKPNADSTMIIAVGMNSSAAVTMVDSSGYLSCVLTFVEKWLVPGTKVIYKSSSIDLSQMTGCVRDYLFIDVDDQKHCSSTQRKD